MNAVLRRRFSKWRRHLYECVGSDRYSRPSLNRIDWQLEKYLVRENGFFIEAGANDGFSQSNTYYLERFRGWRGVLIEPIPRLYEACVRERPNSMVFNCALVASEDTRSSVTMMDAGLMSIVEGARGSRRADIEHVERGRQVQQLKMCREVRIPTRTLTSVLDEVGIRRIDFFSLDVEGYELSVLKGLDLQKYRPEYMLLESDSREQVEAFIKGIYEPLCELSHHDILYRSRQATG